MKGVRNADNERKKLLFLGDSLIEYFDWSERFPEYDVYNFGIAGETVRGLAARLERIVRKVQDPDMVFIMSGINSMAMGDKDIADTYQDIVRALHQAFPEARIYIQSLLPVSFPFIDNGDIRQMNLKLRHIAEEEGVQYLDLHTLFIDQNKQPLMRYFMEDGVHVSGEGYLVWSEEIEVLIR